MTNPAEKAWEDYARLNRPAIDGDTNARADYLAGYEAGRKKGRERLLEAINEQLRMLKDWETGEFGGDQHTILQIARAQRLLLKTFNLKIDPMKETAS